MKGPVEFWKKLPDNAEIEVSSFGRIRSAKGYYYKCYPSNRGYLRVYFCVNGKLVGKLVHRLVAETFIPNPVGLKEVHHRDCDITNNNISNLEWCTRSYNRQYREEFGEPSRHPVFAINLDTLEASWFTSQSEAERVIGVSQGHVSRVIKEEYKQTGGFWLVNADDKAIDITKRKLRDIGETGLKVKQTEDTISINKASEFVSQVLAEYALERKLAYGKQKLA